MTIPFPIFRSCAGAAAAAFRPLDEKAQAGFESLLSNFHLLVKTGSRGCLVLFWLHYQGLLALLLGLVFWAVLQQSFFPQWHGFRG